MSKDFFTIDEKNSVAMVLSPLKKPTGIRNHSMAKIIFTSRYIRNASRAGNLVKYMGTREGVERLPYGVDHSPSTKKQDDLIASIVKKYPTATDYPEYIEYQQKKEKASATEFIDAFIERNSDRIGNFKKLVSYIAERPSVEKLGRHGLQSEDTPAFFLTKEIYSSIVISLRSS